MGLLDRLFVGKSIELGVIHESGKFPFSKTKTTALAVQRRGSLRFVLKTSPWSLFYGGISYDTYSPEETQRMIATYSTEEAQMLKAALSRYWGERSQYEGRDNLDT